ncbi:MAG: hypothetical protein EAZ53_12800 [Bacteroidetes bacterium]|nr:MAG: hypothetical protein EAZ53_12800 [Bacteroidota bacterium]
MRSGIIGINPKITNAKIIGTKLFVKFLDGRELYVPKKTFSFLKGKIGKLFISDSNTLIFENKNEVIHVSELLGRYEDYRYDIGQ